MRLKRLAVDVVLGLLAAVGVAGAAEWNPRLCDEGSGACLEVTCASIEEFISKLEKLDGDSSATKDTFMALSGYGTVGRDKALLLIHAAHKAVKRGEVELDERCKADLPKLRDLVHHAMERAGLRTFGSARIVSGMTMGSVNDGESGEASDDGDPKLGAGIEWESRHFNSDSGTIDASFVARVGYRPALTLVEVVPAVAENGEQAETAMSAKLQTAFGWSGGVQVQAHIAKLHGEAGLRGNVGQTWIGSSSVFSDNGENSSLAIPAGAGDARWFYDIGAQLRIYDRRLDESHEENAIQSPLFGLSVGVRRDNRYKVEDDNVKFDSPTGRWFLRAEVNGLEVVKDLATKEKEGSTEKAETYNVSFVIEHEEGLKKDSGVPSATRFLILGDASIFKLLSGN